MSHTASICIFWFRRDLRLNDNAGLFHALKSGLPVQPIFIFDNTILDKLEEHNDRRVSFIHHYVSELKTALETLGSTLWVFHGTPKAVFTELLKHHKISALYANRDYEPYARERDKSIFELLENQNVSFKAYKDHVIFEKDEVLKDDNSPYTVYTPYSKRWKAKVNPFYVKSYPTEKYFEAFHQTYATAIPSLNELGFEAHPKDWPGTDIPTDIIQQYHLTRDIPGANGTSKLSVHMRFGTLSIRNLMRLAQETSEKWYNELIWREFYQSILWHFPRVVHQSFKPEYDRIQWRNNEEEFERWCNGQTGFPIVDAGMRELLTTGYMHNRVRMIVASFLVKDLLIDWRWGEAWFARKLLDFELASNNGGWQWAAGCGVDAAPYFRVFNPHIQTEKFDPDRVYIRKWVPEFESPDYSRPIVDHHQAKERCLEVFKAALKQ